MQQFNLIVAKKLSDFTPPCTRTVHVLVHVLVEGRKHNSSEFGRGISTQVC